jgi:hypothetical protein
VNLLALNNNRTFDQEGLETVLLSFNRNPLPLYLKLATDCAIRSAEQLIPSSLWKFSGLMGAAAAADGKDVGAGGVGENIVDAIRKLISENIFRPLEKQHGTMVVGRALGFMCASRFGLSSSTIEDLLSCDEDVLCDVYMWWEPPIRRFPTVLWKQLLDDISPYVVEKVVYGINIFSWYHRQFWEAAEKLYIPTQQLKVKVCLIICDYALTMIARVCANSLFFVVYMCMCMHTCDVCVMLMIFLCVIAS